MKPISKRIRFEVFKRDSFTCQYCGRKAPDVILHCDHIDPRASGGSNDITNLITSCVDCNLGKADKKLSDNSVVRLKQDQLAALQERKEQIEMMMEWQRGLIDLDSDAVQKLTELWCELSGWAGIKARGQAEIRKLFKRHGFAVVADSMRAAVDYFSYGDDGVATADSKELAFQKIKPICTMKVAQEKQPWLRDLFYIRKIVENRCSYYNPHQAKKILEDAFEAANEYTSDISGIVETLKQIARDARNWSQWRDETTGYTDQLRDLIHRRDEIEPDWTPEMLAQWNRLVQEQKESDPDG